MQKEISYTQTAPNRPSLRAMPPSHIDSIRAIVIARIDQLGLNLAEVSRGIGRNAAYLQQYIKRGIPRVLPEDVREALAKVLQLPADSLRPALPGRGGPRLLAPDAIATTADEAELLRCFRQLDPQLRARALAVVKALCGPE